MRIGVSLLLEPGDPPAPELSIALESGESVTLTHTAGVAHLIVPDGRPLKITATLLHADASSAGDKPRRR